MTGTDVAIWSAATGTLTFALNFWKGRREAPRVFAVVDAVQSFSEENAFAGIRFTVRNRGGKRTTIERVFLYRRQEWFADGWGGFLFRLLRKVPWQQNVGVSSPKTAKLPATIETGGTWEGFFPLEGERRWGLGCDHAILWLINAGTLRYSIVSSHTRRRIRGVVRIEDPLPPE